MQRFGLFSTPPPHPPLEWLHFCSPQNVNGLWAQSGTEAEAAKWNMRVTKQRGRHR